MTILYLILIKKKHREGIEGVCAEYHIEDGCKDIGPLPSFNKLLRKALVQLGTLYNLGARIQAGILLCTIGVLGFKHRLFFSGPRTFAKSIEKLIERLATLLHQRRELKLPQLAMEAFICRCHQPLLKTMPKLFCLKLNWKIAKTVILP